MTVEFFVDRTRSYTQCRQHERVTADLPVRLEADAARPGDRVIDLSETGARVKTSSPLTPMSLISMHLELPTLDETVAIVGRVMWVTGRVMGIRFERRDEPHHPLGAALAAIGSALLTRRSSV